MAVDVTGIRVSIEGDKAIADARLLDAELGRLGHSGAQAEGAFDKLRRSIFSLQGALGALGIGLTTRELIAFADAATNIQNRLRLVTNSTDELASTQERLFSIAQSTRSSFEGTVDLYGTLARNASALNLEQDQLFQITESVNKSIKSSGTSAQAASAGLVQLSQALGSGVLRGDELNSIMEQMPGLARSIAAGLDVPIGKLRELGAAGELTAEQVVQALLSQSAVIDEEYGKTTATVADAFERIQNSAIKAIGNINEQIGGTDKLSAALNALADNMDILIISAGALTAAIGVKLVSSLTTSAQSTFVSIAAQRAHSLALVEDASRTVASTAAKLAFNNMLVAEAQASVAAATGLSRLSVVQNTLLPAQTRAAAAAAAHTAALHAQTIAANNASLSAGLLRGSLALLGGPVGIAVIAAGTLAILATRETETERQARLAASAHDELKKALDLVEQSTGKARQAAVEQAIALVDVKSKALEAAEAQLVLVESQIQATESLAAWERLKGAGDVGPIKAEAEALRIEVDKLQSGIDALRNSNSLLTITIKEGTEGTRSYADEVEKISDRLDKAGKAAATYKATIDTLTKALAAGDITQSRFNELSALAKAELDRFTESTNKSTSSIKSAVAETDKFADSFQSLRESLDPVVRAEREFQERTELLNRALNEGKIQMGEYNELLGLIFEDFNDVAGGAEESAKSIDTATKSAQNFAAEASPTAQIWEEAATNINNSFTSTFRRILDEGIGGFKDLGTNVLNIFKDILAQMATLAIARPIIVPIVSSLGGILGVSQTAQAGVLNQLGGGGFGLGGFSLPGFSPTTQGANPISPQAAGIGFPGGGASSLPFSGNLSFLNSSSLATNPFLSGAGGFGGNFLANLIFGQRGSGTGQKIGATLGAFGGSFLPLPPGLNTAVGSFIGNLAGKLIEGLFGGGNDFRASLGTALDRSNPALAGTNRDVVGESAFGFVGFAQSRDFASKDAKEFIDGIVQLDNAIAGSLLPAQVDKIREALDGFIGSAEKGTGNLDQIKERIGFALDSAGGLIDDFSDRILEGPVEAIPEWTAALNALQQTMDSDLVEDFKRAIEDQNVTMLDAMNQQAQGVLDLVGAYDGSLSATQRLASGVSAFGQTAVHVLAEIEKARRGIADSTLSAIERIRTSVMTPSEQLTFFTQQGAAEFERLKGLFDPAAINESVQSLQSLTERVFALVGQVEGEQNQRGRAGEFIDFLRDVQAIAQSRLNVSEQTVTDTQATIQSELRSALQQFSADMGAISQSHAQAASTNAQAAQTQAIAAQTQLTAARTPVRVIVDSRGRALSEVGR